MKAITLFLIGTLVALSVGGIAYAHSSSYEESNDSSWLESSEVFMPWHWFGQDNHDRMHEWMTQGMEPELKEQMDAMYNNCPMR